MHHHQDTPPNPSAHMEPFSPKIEMLAKLSNGKIPGPQKESEREQRTDSRLRRKVLSYPSPLPSQHLLPCHHSAHHDSFFADPSAAATSPSLSGFESVPWAHGRAILLTQRGDGPVRPRRNSRLTLQEHPGGARRRFVRRLCWEGRKSEIE